VLEVHQTRAYAYRSGMFAQVAGPTSFVPHSTKIDLSIKFISATWSAQHGDTRTGTITVTVTNKSAATSGNLLLIYTDLNGNATIVKLASLRGHATITKTITVKETDDGYARGSSSISIDELGSGSVGGDANPKDDWTEVKMWY
jgi:hypothetical protein